MRVEPGGIYLVELRLQNAERLGPSWLVGAFAATYPGADVMAVEDYGVSYAVVRIRWRSTLAGEIVPGASVSTLVDALQVPGQAVPSAIVMDVQDTRTTMASLEQRIPDSLKLTLAGAILVTTWYFVSKIKESTHGRPETAGHRAA